MSAPTFRARPMWSETNPIDSSTSRIRRSLASSTRWAASTKLSRAAASRSRSRESPPRFHASSAKAIDAPRFAASRIESRVRASKSRTRSASRAWATSAARTRSCRKASSKSWPWKNTSRARSRSAGRRGLRVLRIARLQETLRREDGVRPRSAAELFGGALRDAGRFLGRGQRGLELAFLESLAGLLEQFLDPLVVDIGIASQHESRIPLRGVLGFEFHEDLGGAGGGGDGGDQVRFPLQSEEAHPMSLAELAELTGSKSFEGV